MNNIINILTLKTKKSNAELKSNIKAVVEDIKLNKTPYRPILAQINKRNRPNGVPGVFWLFS